MPAGARPTGGSARAGRTGEAGLSAVVAHHRGMVTDLLEDLTGEPVDADVRGQWGGPARRGNPLGLDPGADVVQRAVLLRGRRSGVAYVYAESSIAAARLPPSVRRRLGQGRDPIGRVLDDAGLAARREPLGGPATAAHADDTVAALLAEAPVTRRYLLLLETGPAFAVDEWFLQATADALAAQPPG